MTKREDDATTVPGAVFLAGGAEVGALMRVKDWSSTPLGALDGWPQSLRSTVSVMLTAPQPSYIFWGPELAMLYNDRGLPFVGLKHPDCLGQPTPIVLKEAWPVLGSLIEGVMRTGEPVYLENLLIPLERVGFLQDGYFTFSYIAIRNEAGEVGGILVIVNETTAQVVGQRRLSLIRELSLRTALCPTVEATLQATQEVLGQSPADLPFALLYEIRGGEARLVACAGLTRDTPAAPSVIALADERTWALGDVVRARTERVVENLAATFGPLPGGPSGDAATRALLLPLANELAGDASHVLVAGLNPRLAVDDDLRSFVQLLTRQIVTSIASTRALQEKTQRAAQLAELDRQKTEFFSNVSHEFRTPLTLMLGPVEDVIERDGALSGESLRALHRNALRLLKLVNNLLDFSRVEADRARASYRPTNLAELTVDLASGFRSVVESAGLGFEIACAPGQRPTLVDVDMWEKIVLNLLSNAFKFTFEGKIVVGLEQTGDHAVLSVSDTGVGIPSEELPRLFDRFHRVAGTRSRTHEGSGIGLALVAELARLHGGSVDVASEVGVGTTFKVTIPQQPAAVEPASMAEAPRASTATKPLAYVEEALRWLPDGNAAAIDAPVADARAQRSARVLVAEDNADMRDYLTRLLSERWTVETAADGTQALAAATANPPDVIVSDMMMPGIDGLALVRALRADERTREVPFILLSARADERSTTDALEHGASDYMVKPFSARELIARVGAQMAIAAVQRAARQRLEALLMEAPAAIAVVRGPSLVFALANERYRQIVGQRPVLGQPARVVLPELSDQGVWDLVDKVYATGEPFNGTAFAADLPTGADGALEQSFFNWTAQPTRGLDGEVEGVMIFAVDVSEHERSRQRLEEASGIEQALRGEAEAAGRAKDEFLAMLGHELRNPLAPIATALQLMKLRGDTEMLRERQVIERQVTHLEGLVSDLLDVSRITQGKIDLKRAPIELSEVIAEAVEMASTLLEQRRHRLDITVASSGLPVDGDVVRLKQVFANLITNAAKYTEPGGHLSIEAKRRAGSIIVYVKDNGIGISASMLPRVFDLFSQVPQSLARSQGGLGLGLSIVRSLVEMHGGRVQAHSRGEGHGSTFTVELPVSTQTAEPTLRVEPGPTPTMLPAQVPSRILIVDDNQDAAELLSEMLRTVGHITHVAHDGPHALRVVGQFKPTVALFDIGLPAMDGYELARRLREEPTLQALRLVAITGYGQLEDRRRSSNAGFDAHLVKPVQLDAITQLLDKLPG